MQISHNGDFIIAADENGVVYRIDSNFKSTPVRKETDKILSTAISANDNYVLTGGTGKKLLVWSVNENDMVFDHEHGCMYLLFCLFVW